MGSFVRNTFVAGHPRPKGSLEPQMVRNGAGRLTGKVRMVEASPEGPRWRRTIAQHVVRLGWTPILGPCWVTCIFWFDRPTDEPTEAQGEYPCTPYIGDIDKLVRNVLDALQDAKLYANDRQVVGLGNTSKFWTGPYDSNAGLGLWVEGR